jgi:hypothetical protein
MGGQDGWLPDVGSLSLGGTGRRGGEVEGKSELGRGVHHKAKEVW